MKLPRAVMPLHRTWTCRRLRASSLIDRGAGPGPSDPVQIVRPPLHLIRLRPQVPGALLEMVRLQARLRGPVSELGGLRAILELVLRSPAGRPGEYRPLLRRGHRRRGLRCRYWVLGPRLHGRLERAFEHKSYVHGLTTRKYRPVHRPTREDLRRGAWLHAKLRGSAPHAGSLSRARSRSRDHRGRCRRPRPRHLHGRGDDRAEHDPPHDRIGAVRQTPHHRRLHGGRAATNLAALLRAVDGLAGKFRVRVGMADPLTVYPIVDELVEAYGSEKIFKFLHLPVQSGDDAILEAMRREYNVAQFEDIVHTFRRAYPRITLSTDVIVGFPGEDDDQFGKTMELIERIRPDIVNVTRFSPRVGTPAARMPNPIVGWRVKERSRQLTWMRFEIAQQIHEAFVGEEVEVLLTEPGKESTVLARTPEYRQVVLAGPLPLGAFAPVRIEAARATDLRGTLLAVPTEFPQSSSAA